MQRCILVRLENPPCRAMPDPDPQSALTIKRLLRPHYKSLALGVLVVAGGSIADLLQPWPLKVVIDTVLKRQAGKGWSAEIVVYFAGRLPLSSLRFAALAVLL